MPHHYLSLFAAIALAAQMSGSCCTWTHTPELFPTRVRGVANALCNSFARMGAAVSPYVISDMLDPITSAAIMALMSLVAVAAISFVKETAGAKLDDDDVETSDDEPK